MAEDCGNLQATGTFDVHEKTVGVLNQPLQLMLLSLLTRIWVRQIDIHCNRAVTRSPGHKQGSSTDGKSPENGGRQEPEELIKYVLDLISHVTTSATRCASESWSVE
eukprot:GHVQ01012554.1.p1 GENE.GHVQ01012554.1~~GHVQ01012554.1.p1  ORF type:complete len:107 (-),score=8.61 GHVQ01012554.1:14-334(-)